MTERDQYEDRRARVGLPHPNSSWFHPPEKVKIGAKLSMYLLMATVTALSVIAWIVWAVDE
jgi:hypothetical protein